MRTAIIKRFDGEVDEIITYSYKDFPYYQLNTKALKCRRKSKKVEEYIYDFATFDIETTTIEPGGEASPYGFMYHWQMNVAGLVITGRTWEEWLTFMNRLHNVYKLSYKRRLVVYVHNLSFEFQFIKDFLERDFEGYDLFARARRQPIHVTAHNGFEFRCSYILTNMSLENACKNEHGIIHPKAPGDLDYGKLRTSTTPLDNTEFGYCVSDVVCLYELIKCRLHNDKDNLESIPMTSTGYVRRECRKACKKNPHYHDFIRKLELKLPVYNLLKEAGRGGNTHANRYYSGRIWQNCDSFDVVSSYPAQMLLQRFPMTAFTAYGDIETIEELNDLLGKYACLFRICFLNLHVKEVTPMPYIPVSKALEYTDARLDNGRVLKASYLKMAITDIDYKIIASEYTWDGITIEDMHIAKYALLPEELRGAVMEFFKQKTDLKDAIAVETDKEKIAFLKYLYAKSKNRLNGIFGMCYTDPVRATITIKNGEWVEELPNIEETLRKVTTGRNNFLYYAWGVWITCWARLWLENLINATNTNGGVCIYVDTDSSKCMGADTEEVEKLNRDIMKKADGLGAYYDLHGKRYYMGVYEHENEEPIKKFKTLGAKKYCYEDEDGFHITISGVEKKKGAREMGSVENFRPGFIFKDAGGLTLYYNDSDISEIVVEGVRMTTASNIGMVESTYELGITNEYAEIIGYNFFLDV